MTSERSLVSLFHSRRTILKNNEFDPKDMIVIILNCFKVSLTKDINMIVSTIANNQMLGNEMMIPDSVGDMSDILSTSSNDLDEYL